MGTYYPVKIEDPVADRVKSMLNCGNFASSMLQVGKSITMHYIANKKEINCEHLCKEFRINASLHIGVFEKSCGYLPGDMNFCSDPMIEGGNKYNLYLKKFKKAKHFGFDVFKYSIGIKMNNYCCYFVRTTIINCTRQISENYAFMMSVYQNVLRHLMDGMELCKVYETVYSFAKEKNNKLAEHLEKEFGFELSHDFENRSVLINSDSKVVARNDMIFAININLIGLEENGKEYSLFFSDTVVVRKDQTPMKLMTHNATHSKLKRITSP